MVTPTQMAHYEEAVKHYSRAVEMRPNFALPYIYRGDIYRKMGKFDLAIATTRKPFLDPASPQRLITVAVWHTVLKETLTKQLKTSRKQSNTNRITPKRITIAEFLCYKRRA